MLDWMPVQGSDWAAKVDWINNVITYISVFFIILITGVMVFFAVRYRRRSEHDKTAYITHDAALETVWTVVPAVICVFVFYFGFVFYKETRIPPNNPIEINVEAFTWRWEFKHPNGKRATDELVVPIGRPIRLIMKSNDVLHSFFIPAMRIKEDVAANRYSYTWFTPAKLGDFHIFCAEYCGLNHWAMRGVLRVVTPEEYQDYILDRGETEELSPVELGRKLYLEKGCNACHSLDGSAIIGPSFKSVFGAVREFADGTSEVADENYIRESILYPEKKIVAGFAQMPMPSYKGQLTEDELLGLIAYIKSLE